MTTLNWEKAAQRDKVNKNGYCDINRPDKKSQNSLNAMRVELENLLHKKNCNVTQRKRIKTFALEIEVLSLIFKKLVILRILLQIASLTSTSVF